MTEKQRDVFGERGRVHVEEEKTKLAEEKADSLAQVRAQGQVMESAASSQGPVRVGSCLLTPADISQFDEVWLQPDFGGRCLQSFLATRGDSTGIPSLVPPL